MQEWFGKYLSEPEIVEDIYNKVIAVPETVDIWLDHNSWYCNFNAKKLVEHAGALMFAPMHIRNFYGLWHKENPHTVLEPEANAEGIIDHPQFPDNLSGRVIDAVKEKLKVFKNGQNR